MLDSTPAASRDERAAATVSAVLSGDVALAGLDALVRSAAVTTWAPVALVSMVTDRQVTASVQRVSGEGPTATRGSHVSLEDSICVHALRADGPIRVADARRDERFATLPAVLAGEFRAYLGVPLRAADGDLVGVLCVYDAAPRSWTEAEEHDLDGVAARVAVELERLTAEYAGHAGQVSRDAVARGPR